MIVQVLNNDNSIVWRFDVTAPRDESGKNWLNGNHELMAGVIGSLRLAYKQAQIYPKNWDYPFATNLKDIHEGKKGLVETARKVAYEGIPHTRPAHHKSCCESQKGGDYQLSNEQILKLLFAFLHLNN